MKGRTQEYYSSVVEVIFYTGFNTESVTKSNGEYLSETEFVDRIEEMLLEAKSLIDEYCSKNFSALVKAGRMSKVPEGVHGIARRIVADLLAQVVIREDNNNMRIDETGAVLRDTVFNKNIRNDLDLYKRRGRIRFSLTGVKQEEKEGVQDVSMSGVYYVEVETSVDLSKGDLVNMYTYEGMKVRKADGLLGRSAQGFVKADYVSGDKARVYLDGLNSYMEGLVVGKQYYLDREGKVTDSIGTNLEIIQAVGFSVGVDKLDFNAGNVTNKAM